MLKVVVSVSTPVHVNACVPPREGLGIFRSSRFRLLLTQYGTKFHSFIARVGKVRPAGQIRPASSVDPARGNL